MRKITKSGYDIGDVRGVIGTLASDQFHCCVTSPPYWGLRDYGVDGQIGLEPTIEEYVQTMVDVFREVRRVLRPDGTLWLNLGDTYNRYPHVESHTFDAKVAARNRENGYPARKITQGLPEKNLIGMPWRVAFALQADGWILRQDIIWEKVNPMPESISDRCTKAHEYVFLMAKQKRYHFDQEAIKEPAVGASRKTGVGWDYDKGKRSKPRCKGEGQNDTRNKRSVWTIPTQSYAGAHFATFPENLIRPCILAGCPANGIVLDPFFGTGTTGRVAEDSGRRWFGIEINPEYGILIDKRTAQRSIF